MRQDRVLVSGRQGQQLFSDRAALEMKKDGHARESGELWPVQRRLLLKPLICPKSG